MTVSFRKKLFLAGIIGVILCAAAGYSLYLQHVQQQKYTGTIEATQADITPKISGYIQHLAIKEGAHVAAGNTAATLNARDQLAQLAQSQAAYEKAVHQLADLEKGARAEELREAAANTAAAQSTYDKAAADYTRYQALAAGEVISAQEFDTASLAYETAKQALAAAREREQLLIAGSRPDEILAQRSEVARSKAALDNASFSVEDMTLFVPISGIVLSKNYEEGEYITAGSALATIADLQDCYVRIYVPSSLLGTISLGQKAEVSIDAYPDTVFEGYIKEISDTAEYTPRQSISPEERANMVFSVKVQLPNHQEIFKPGMIADVRFL